MVYRFLVRGKTEIHAEVGNFFEKCCNNPEQMRGNK